MSWPETDSYRGRLCCSWRTVDRKRRATQARSDSQARASGWRWARGPVADRRPWPAAAALARRPLPWARMGRRPAGAGSTRLAAQVLHVRVGAKPHVVGQIEPRMVRILVDDDLV